MKAMPATRTIHRRVIALCAAFALAHSAHASEFSAEIVSRDAAGSPVGVPAKIYVSNRLVRIETPEAADGFFLIDADAGVVRVNQPGSRFSLHSITKIESRLLLAHVLFASATEAERRGAFRG